MTPTKGEPLVERLKHAFGERHINEAITDMMRGDLIGHLTDEARDELASRLISQHRRSRRYAAQNRKAYRERQKVVA